MLYFFFFNDTATTEIYTLSLHDALPIFRGKISLPDMAGRPTESRVHDHVRSEEHTSELQSLAYLVCRLLLEKKKKTKKHRTPNQTNNNLTHPKHVPNIVNQHITHSATSG